MSCPCLGFTNYPETNMQHRAGGGGNHVVPRLATPEDLCANLPRSCTRLCCRCERRLIPANVVPFYRGGVALIVLSVCACVSFNSSNSTSLFVFAHSLKESLHTQEKHVTCAFCSSLFSGPRVNGMLILLSLKIAFVSVEVSVKALRCIIWRL